MSNIDIYKEYIQDSIINRLEHLMGNDVGDDVNLWEKYDSKGLTPQKDSVYRSMLQAMMVPYYKMYLNGDTRLCCAGSRLESIGRVLSHVIADDDTPTEPVQPNIIDRWKRWLNELMKDIVRVGAEKDAIILDFFSGSATTAHAVIELNDDDGGHRSFIMIQQPEPCKEDSEAYKAGYKTICDIGKERIRRAMEDER